MAVLEKEATMTLAERRAAARRKKILDNMDGRMGRILGSTASSASNSSLEQLSPVLDISPKEMEMIPPNIGRIITSDCNFNCPNLTNNIPKLDLPLKHNAQGPFLPMTQLKADQKREPLKTEGLSSFLSYWKVGKTLIFIGIAILGIYLEQSILKSFLAVQGVCLPASWLFSRQESLLMKDSHKLGAVASPSLGNNRIDNSRHRMGIFLSKGYRLIQNNLVAEFIMFVFLSLASFALFVLFRLI